MPTLTRAIQWYINSKLPGGRNALLDGETSNPPNLAPMIMQGDAFPLQLFFRTPGAEVGSATTAVSLEAGYRLGVVGKLASDLDNDTVLFDCFDWAPTEGSDCYTGMLNLADDRIADAFAASNGQDKLEVAVDIEYANDTNTQRLTYRANIEIGRQVYQGSEPLAPAARSGWMFATPGGEKWLLEIKDGGVLNQTRIA